MPEQKSNSPERPFSQTTAALHLQALGEGVAMSSIGELVYRNFTGAELPPHNLALLGASILILLYLEDRNQQLAKRLNSESTNLGLPTFQERFSDGGLYRQMVNNDIGVGASTYGVLTFGSQFLENPEITSAAAAFGCTMLALIFTYRSLGLDSRVKRS